MQITRNELNLSIIDDGYENVSFIRTNDVINAFAKLKSGKHDGSLGQLAYVLIISKIHAMNCNSCFVAVFCYVDSWCCF